MKNMHKAIDAFTLIELSIVLVIIGLIVGGVLVGRDLIKSSEIRAQVSQIEKYNAAVNTFRGKYGYLPGDIIDPDASNFGFVVRGTSPGQGDGNGIVQSPHGCFAYTTVGYALSEGEQSVLWRDLSKAGLIAEGFTTASETVGSAYSGSNLDLLYPQAKIGNGNYLHVISDGVGSCTVAHDAKNYFALAVITGVNATALTSVPGISVAQAYTIDGKVDDGLPQKGNVQAWYDAFPANGVAWVSGGAAGSTGGLPGAATAASSTTCYDNANTASNPMAYSMSQSNGGNINCALAFRFQ